MRGSPGICVRSARERVSARSASDGRANAVVLARALIVLSFALLAASAGAAAVPAPGAPGSVRTSDAFAVRAADSAGVARARGRTAKTAADPPSGDLGPSAAPAWVPD